MFITTGEAQRNPWKNECEIMVLAYEFAVTCAERSRSKQANSMTKPTKYNVMNNNRLCNSVIGSPVNFL